MKVLADCEFIGKIEDIVADLEKCAYTGEFEGCGKIKLYYEYFLCENPKASIVIVHGLSEFTKKYYELVSYFQKQRYNVFLFDQRCHGFSERLTDEMDRLHVNHFDDYVRDLEIFIDDIVSPVSDLPLYLYSHSMGGAVSALYLTKHADKVKKAVLSAPLFSPIIGDAPYWLARMWTFIKSVFSGKKSNFQVSRKFNPESAMKNMEECSRSRFIYYLMLRSKEVRYQTTPLSSWWVYNSLRIERIMKRRKAASRIKTPLLLITAEQDTVVNTDKHFEFADKCAACRLVQLKGATHSIMTENDETIEEYLDLILKFYESE